jgi:ABC-type sugar transport system permease subunit
VGGATVARTRRRAPAGGGAVRTASGLYRWGSVTPVVALVALFTLFPLAYAAWTSVRGVLLTQPGSTPFVGLDNYTDVIRGSAFRGAARNSLLFTAVSVPLVTVLGLAVALLLN